MQVTTTDIRPGQSIELLKELHILTRDGKMNQDSRRKLKQVNHLFQFIEPLLEELRADHEDICLVDHGAGKSYLGFILYDLFCKDRAPRARLHGIETRVDLVTALHACDTATDDAIRFAMAKQAGFVVLVPCCQAEVAATLRRHKGRALANPLAELWRHPIHTREFGSHVTNVLRCLQLEAHGYQVGVTELVGWEHSLKNELIVARYQDLPRRRAAERLNELLGMLGLEELRERFVVGP